MKPITAKAPMSERARQILSTRAGARELMRAVLGLPSSIRLKDSAERRELASLRKLGAVDG